MAGVLAVVLALTGSLIPLPEPAEGFRPGFIHAYATEPEPSDADAELSSANVEAEGAEREDGTEETDVFNAALGGIRKYFMKLGARAFQTVTPGESLPESTTFVSFDTADGYYYLVRQRTEPESDPELPDTAEQALDQGWIRKTGAGTYVWRNLLWNRTYDVYELNLSVSPAGMRKLGSATTVKGKAGGTALIEGLLLVGNKVNVKVEEPSTEAGSWSWYTSDSADAAAWTPCTEGISGTAGEELTIPSSAAGLYLKAVFTPTAGGEFEGSIEIISGQPAASLVTGVTIAGTVAIGENLTASVAPAACAAGVRYDWYRAAPESAESTGGQFLYTGNPYTIQAEDIGKRLYVNVVSLPSSVSSGEAVSLLTDIVNSVPYAAPAAPEVKKRGATALVVGMSSGTDEEGLYEFGYSTQANPDKEGADFHKVTAKARGTVEVTIPELSSSTRYYIWARRAGESGFSNSPWSAAAVSGTTLPPALTGVIILSGACAYGETLTASLSIPGQNGSFHWYRDGAELTDSGNPSFGAGNSSYQLGTADIGKQLTVLYRGAEAGSGSPSSGELTSVSDVIEKKTSAAPVLSLSDSEVIKTDSSLAFPLPSGGIRQMKLGYAYSSTAAPAAGNSLLAPGTQAVIPGLDRNTEYYLFLKYAETETEKESGWSAAAGPFRTNKRSISEDNIEFNLTAPHPGKLLTAELTSIRDLGEIEGTWSWTENVGGIFTPITFVEDVDTPERTSYLIPESTAAGTTYTVTFTGKNGMDGEVTGTSPGVTQAMKVPYPTPAAPVIAASSDGTLTVGRPAGAEGIYQFSYGLTQNGAESEWTTVENTSYGANTIVISGLVRNTDYYVRAKRLSLEDGYSDSGWSAPIKQKTGLTELGGSIGISGSAVNGETLTAVYTGASYLPAGNDMGGSYRWQKALCAVTFLINGEEQEPVYTDIPGAVTDTYHLTSADVNYKLKAIYTAPSPQGFKGEKTAETDVVKKTVQTAPGAAELEAGNLSEDQIWLHVKALSPTGYYQIRTRNAELPKAPELAENAAGLGWKQPAGTEADIHTYYDPTAAAEAELIPGTEYIVYTVYAGTGDLQPSEVVVGTSFITGSYKQTGTITYTSAQDSTGGIIVSGGELKAELTGGNSSTGSWKWYVSANRYSVGIPGSDDWVYLPSGYYPVNNSTTSILTLTDDMLGKYIRAEFVADPSGTYAGTIGETSAGEGYYSHYVKKIYREKLKIESSSTNGFGEPMAYAGSTLTGTIENYAESGALNSNRTTVQLLSDGVVMTEVMLNYNENTFTCILPRNKARAGQTITASVSKPRDLNLYVTETLGIVNATALNSAVSTGTSLVYKDGIPISTTEQFEALLKKGSADGQSYADWTDTYVLAENIRCEAAVSIPSARFSGVLDGDYHTITNLKNVMFAELGSGTKVQNIIFNVANVSTYNLSVSGSNSAALIARISYGDILFSRLFLSQATVDSAWDAAYLLGKTNGSAGTVTLEECGSAGGTIKITKSDNKSAGGMIGCTDVNGTLKAKNLFSYRTELIGRNNTSRLSGISIINGTGTAENVVAACTLTNKAPDRSGGVLGSDLHGQRSYTHAYYDSTLIPDGVSSNGGMPLETKSLIGTNLEAAFGTEKWSYAEGYYPRLIWLKDDPVAALFAATRGAFSSADGKTSSDDMFEGNISGSIEIPAEMRTEWHRYESTGDLAVDESGLITPTGTGGGIITVIYDDGLYSAENTYEFNTSRVTDIKENFQSVTLSPATGVQIGTVLTADVQLAASDTTTDPDAITYQWYKRANESTEKVLLTGETGRTYTVKPTDAGYNFMVVASANGYWDSGTGFTNTIEVTAPSGPPDVVVNDYQTVTVTGRGGVLSMYDFAYAKTATGEKTIVSCDPAYPDSQVITGLEANTDYFFFSRVAAGDGYSVSPWSTGIKITTGKIPLEGTMTLNGSKNVDTTLTAVMGDNNLQTGSWTVERVDGASYTELTAADGVTFRGAYEASYLLKSEDVGKKIRFTFTANGKFSGNTQSVSEVIEKSVHTAPVTAPVLKQKTDTTVTLEAYSGNAATDLTIYQYGCQVGNGTIMALEGTVEAAAAGIKISGLFRNTAYSFYVRRRADDGYVSSNWSPALAVTTDKTNISGKGPLVFTIGGKTESQAVPTVEDSVTAAAPSGLSGLTGTWGLEKKTLTGESATLSGYTVADGGLSISYTLGAQDAGYTLQAVFRGTGDFTGEIVTPMSAVVARRRYPAPANGSFTVIGRTDTTIIVRMESGLSGSYQFGKCLSGGGTVETCVGSVQQGNSYTMTGLERNKSYDIFIRRIQETGYITSDWSAAVGGTTDKTEINGDIRITGTVEIGSTLTAEYQGGFYAQNGVRDDKGGSYTWKIDDAVVKSDPETAVPSTYTILEGEGGKKISVIYTPPGSSDFQGSKTKLAGTVAKSATAQPAVPVVSTQVNTEAGSVLRITNAENGVWYIPVKYSETTDTRPDLVPKSDAEAAGWVEATGTTLDVAGLAANTDYLIYGAHLETETSAASLLTVSEKVRTYKEEIAKGGPGSGSTGITGPAALKPMDGDGTKVSIAVYGKAPTGTWNWYTAKQAGGSDGWKIIRSEKHEEAAGAVEASDTYQIPYEYSGYYLKVEFQADGDYSGLESWEPAEPLADRELTGTVTITPDGGNGNERLFEKLTATYGGTDDKNGTWIWYREDNGSAGGWRAISTDLYTTAGEKSIYTPAAEDKGKKLKAVYTAASFGSTGSREAETGAVAAAVQTTPLAPKIVLISGTNIALADSDPGKAGPYGNRPEVIFGYRKASEPEGTVTWLENGNVVSGLSPATGYIFYTKYKSTDVYAESPVSPATAEILTGAGILYQSNLSLSYDTSDGEDKKMDVGRIVTAVYQGEGWDKGDFSMKRSDGQIVTEFTQTVDDTNQKVTCAYQLPLTMAGFSLTFVYTAKAESGYNGSVEILTGAVKKAAGTTPSAPVLEKHLDTDLYLTNVTDGQEYAILKEPDGGGAPEEPARYSSLWQTLTADGSGKWRYTGLERGTTYYVYTRTVETPTAEVSQAVISNAVTTESYLYMGAITLKNEKDLHTQPMGSGSTLDIPSTLNGKVRVKTIRVYESGGSTQVSSMNPSESLTEFVSENSDGTRTPNPNVYEKGSSWANGRFATTLSLLKNGSQYAELELGGSQAFEAGDQMALSVYRANAVTDGGSYLWEIVLEDDDGNEALLKADVAIVTQLEFTIPLSIGLMIKDQEILQTTTGAGLKNGNGMPVQVSMDTRPITGAGVPALLGEPSQSDPELMPDGAVYLKMSVDNSLETGRVDDIWLNTTLGTPSVRPLVKLGASSQAPYYISGMISRNGTVTWPWPSEGERTIPQAYKMKFTYEILSGEYPVYTPEISSSETATAAQEGGDS